MSSECRRPAVAGTFYPATPETLATTVANLLESASNTPSTPNTITAPVKAIIVPHAGYIYSGAIAACLYSAIKSFCTNIQRVVLLGPSHRIALEGLALPASTHFSSPLGDVLIDQAAIRSILDLPQVCINDAAHAQEHALEVQLPFLQTVLSEFTLLPLSVGRCTPQAVAEVLNRLWGGPETLVVVSSDLSHYLPYADAQHLDSATAAQILTLQPTINHQQACGATPINGLLIAAQQQGLQAHLLDLRNSGDTAGDKSRVVGYAAFAFTEPRTAPVTAPNTASSTEPTHVH